MLAEFHGCILYVALLCISCSSKCNVWSVLHKLVQHFWRLPNVFLFFFYSRNRNWLQLPNMFLFFFYFKNSFFLHLPNAFFCSKTVPRNRNIFFCFCSQEQKKSKNVFMRSLGFSSSGVRVITALLASRRSFLREKNIWRCLHNLITDSLQAGTVLHISHQVLAPYGEPDRTPPISPLPQ